MISIVIPSYNQQEYLPDAIESALNQTMKCDVVVVDDGSTDNSLAIARGYPVRVISQVNKGLASARNTGLMNSLGDRVLFLDADDMLVEHCIGTLVNFDADVVVPSFRAFGANQGDVILIPNPTLNDFKQGNRLGYCALFKKQVLFEVGGYSPRMTWGYEDLHLWYDLLSRGKKIETIQEILWLYRTKEHSMIHDALKHHDELMAQIKKDFPNA